MLLMEQGADDRERLCETGDAMVEGVAEGGVGQVQPDP
jgi:hypothetical protein